MKLDSCSDLLLSKYQRQIRVFWWSCWTLVFQRTKVWVSHRKQASSGDQLGRDRLFWLKPYWHRYSVASVPASCLISSLYLCNVSFLPIKSAYTVYCNAGMKDHGGRVVPTVSNSPFGLQDSTSARSDCSVRVIVYHSPSMSSRFVTVHIVQSAHFQIFSDAVRNNLPSKVQT